MAMKEDKGGGEVIKRTRRARRKRGTSAPVAESEQTLQDDAVQPAASDWKEQFFATSIRQVDITTFLRQLIMLLEAGTPLLKSLNTLATRGEKPLMRALVRDIARYVEMGNPLWQAFKLKGHEKYFDEVFVNLIKASEASGTLVTVLQRTADYRDKRELLRKRVRGGMLYPVILVFACLGVVMFIAKVVVPEFEDMFSKFQMELEPFTEYFLAASKAIGNYWWTAIVFIGALTAVYKLYYVRNPLRRIKADRIKLRIPIVGPIVRKNAIVEFTRTFSLLLRSGLSMMATLDLVRNAIHNRAVAHTLQSMRDSVERGAGLEEPMRKASHIIPPVVADMMVTGEESGRLDAICEQIANTYEEEVNISISTLGEALQPIITIFIGLMVIMLMLAVFMPMIAMLEQISGG